MLVIFDDYRTFGSEFYGAPRGPRNLGVNLGSGCDSRTRVGGGGV